MLYVVYVIVVAAEESGWNIDTVCDVVVAAFADESGWYNVDPLTSSYPHIPRSSSYPHILYPHIFISSCYTSITGNLRSCASAVENARPNARLAAVHAPNLKAGPAGIAPTGDGYRYACSRIERISEMIRTLSC